MMTGWCHNKPPCHRSPETHWKPSVHCTNLLTHADSWQAAHAPCIPVAYERAVHLSKSQGSISLLPLLNTLCAQHSNYIDECFCLLLRCRQFMAEVTWVTDTHDGRHTQVKSTIHDQHFAIREVSNSFLPLVILLQGFNFYLWSLRVCLSHISLVKQL